MALKNQIFVIVIESIMAVVAEFFSRTKPEFEVSKRVIEKHKEILAAIIKRDQTRAISLIEDHLLNVKDRYRKTMNGLAE